MKPQVALLVAVLFAGGCAGSVHSSSDATAADASDAAASANASSAPGTASGHLQLTGGYTLDRNFAIAQCAIGPPGDGLLSGYHMTADDTDEKIQLLSVTVKDYARDGSFSPSDKTTEGQVGAAMRGGVMGPLMVIISQGEGQVPLSIMLRPESTMNIDISDNGSTGKVEFANMETPVTMDDMQGAPIGATPHGKKISGTVTWSCGKVDRIDPKMNGAVNGMFNKLVPTSTP